MKVFSSPKIMGVLNLTPDSFSDGGKFNEKKRALQRLEELIEQGADIIDIGGESTGPGSGDVSVEEELARVAPIIDVAAESGFLKRALFSIDTYKSGVAEYALKKGFHMVNDVTALRGDSKMINMIYKYKPYLCLMYSKDDTARTKVEKTEYEDVVETVKNFLKKRADLALEHGIPKERIILDPGMGTFVSAEPKYSFELIERLPALKELGYPLLIGISRKSCLGGRLEERDPASVEWSLKALQNGASIIRIHNVALLKEALYHKSH